MNSLPSYDGVVDLTMDDDIEVVDADPVQRDIREDSTCTDLHPNVITTVRVGGKDVRAIDVEALHDEISRESVRTLPVIGILSATHGGGPLYVPNYAMIGTAPLNAGPGLGFVGNGQYALPAKTTSTASRPHIPADYGRCTLDSRVMEDSLRASVAVYSEPAPFFEFSLLNSTEFIIETASLNRLLQQRKALQVLNTVPGIRFDKDEAHWVCPLSMHDNVSYALFTAGALMSELPRTVLSALSLSAKRRDGDASRVDTSSVQQRLPYRLYSALAPFQREGVAFALNNDGKVFIADEMGLGKTIQAIAVAAAYSHDWPVLVVCPSGAKYHWRAEILQWLSRDSVGTSGLVPSDILLVESGSPCELPTKESFAVKFMIVSYGLISKLQEYLSIINFRIVIVDESHNLKNHKARRTVCLEKIIQGAERAVLLSGTPALSR